MIASAQHKLLFVHVQKTGGLTIERVLEARLDDARRISGLPGNKHVHLSTAIEAHPELAGYWSFGFVRNPWARLLSWHSMIIRRRDTAASGHERTAQRMRNNSFWTGVATQVPEFEAFVMEGPDRFPRIGTPQLDYLTDGDRRVDFIGRTESLDADLVEVFRQRGIAAPDAVPHRNAGPPTDYRDAYTPEMRRRVEELFARDIEEFGYTF